MSVPAAIDSEREILATVVAMVKSRLPDSYGLIVIEKPEPAGPVDAVLRVTDGARASADLLTEVKRVVERRDVAPIVDQLRSARSTDATRQTYPLVVSRYLSASVRQALEERGVSYADATGNVRIHLEQPAIFLADRGSDNDPWRNRTGRPRGTLKGTPASRVVRTLADYSREWKIRELVAESGASTGATYRVLDYLLQEALIEKTGTGEYVAADWRLLLESWSRDYGFLRSNKAATFIEPRGLDELTQRLPGTDGFRWAVTGSLASAHWYAYAPPRVAAIYVDSVSAAAQAWGLRPAEAGSNVILAEPESDIAFASCTETSEGIRIAAASQVAVDLLTGPGRNPSEGAELLNWMEQNERAWRRS